MVTRSALGATMLVSAIALGSTQAPDYWSDAGTPTDVVDLSTMVAKRSEVTVSTYTFQCSSGRCTAVTGTRQRHHCVRHESVVLQRSVYDASTLAATAIAGVAKPSYQAIAPGTTDAARHAFLCAARIERPTSDASGNYLHAARTKTLRALRDMLAAVTDDGSLPSP